MKSYFSLFMLAAIAFSSSARSPVYDGGIPESLQVQNNANDNDSERLRKLLQQTSQGIPEYDIATIDPLWIEAVDVAFISDNVFYQNREITVKGLKNQEIIDFRIDPASKIIILKALADVTIVGNVTGIFTDTWNRCAGRFCSNGKVSCTAVSSYELLSDDAGVQHLWLGAATIDCQVVRAPVVKLYSELEQALSSDSAANALHSNKPKRDAMRETNFCEIAERAYAVVVRNVRAAADILPASAFFEDLQ